MMIKVSVQILLLLAVLPGGLHGQVPADSVAAWTERLATGSTVERVGVAGKLAMVEQALPDATRAAVLHELDRLHDLMLEGAEIPEAIELEYEDFGAYYMNLVTMAAAFRTLEADVALIPAVGVARGIKERVAEIGDRAVPLLAEMIRRGHDPTAALSTLGLAWFWADSTGAALSRESRDVILVEVLGAARDDDSIRRFGAAVALTHLGDPSWLPLARALESELADSHEIGLGQLRASTIPALEARAAAMSTAGLASRSRLLLELMCADAASGARRGACESLENSFDAAAAHLDAGRTRAARNAFEGVIRRADQALARGGLTEHEHALIAGGAQQVLDRL